MCLLRLLPPYFVVLSIALAPSLSAPRSDDPFVPNSNRPALGGLTTDLSRFGMQETVVKVSSTE